MTRHSMIRSATALAAAFCALQMAGFAVAPFAAAQEVKSEKHKPLPIPDPPVPTAASVEGISSEGVLRDPSLAPLDFRERRPAAEDFDRIAKEAARGPVRVIL